MDLSLHNVRIRVSGSLKKNSSRIKVNLQLVLPIIKVGSLPKISPYVGGFSGVKLKGDPKNMQFRDIYYAKYYGGGGWMAAGKKSKNEDLG